MTDSLMRKLLGFSVLALVLAVVGYFLLRPAKVVVPQPQPQPPNPELVELGKSPDWNRLQVYQETMTAAEFERLLTGVFTVGDGWKQWIELGSDQVEIRTQGDWQYRLRMATVDRPVVATRYWRTADELPAAPVGRPLEGLHIALDAGHIGGEWAKMEERWFEIGDAKPVCEGDMSLEVARILKPLLENLGARVSMVRDSTEPVTTLRPDDLVAMAKESLPTDVEAWKLQNVANRLFYRTAEIHARAKKVNESIKPDVVLCLHFNAEGWGNPKQPTLVDRHHFHILVNGAYGADEIAFEDQRYDLIEKILSRSYQEEAKLGASIADVFARSTDMPSFTYPPDSPNARPVENNPCLWARNLLANRLYDCPVIFMEPYVMNSTLDYPRIQAGDYLGMKEVGGKLQPSIYREYAEILCAGMVRHCNERRK